MFLMIDNYDSFVYNLVSYFLEENIEMKIIRNDLVDLKGFESIILRTPKVIKKPVRRTTRKKTKTK